MIFSPRTKKRKPQHADSARSQGVEKRTTLWCGTCKVLIVSQVLRKTIFMSTGCVWLSPLVNMCTVPYTSENINRFEPEPKKDAGTAISYQGLKVVASWPPEGSGWSYITCGCSGPQVGSSDFACSTCAAKSWLFGFQCSTGAASDAPCLYEWPWVRALLKSEEPTFCSTGAASEIREANFFCPKYDLATIFWPDGAPLVRSHFSWLICYYGSQEKRLESLNCLNSIKLLDSHC